MGQFTSLALDSSYRPYISYYDASKQDLKLANWDGVQWIVQALDQSGDVGKFTSLALGNFDAPNISYYDATNGNLKYMTYTTAWTATVVDQTNDVGQYTSIALDGSKIHTSATTTSPTETSALRPDTEASGS